MKRVLCVLGLVLPVFTTAWAGKLYKWTDQDGVTHYSDKLPPDSSAQAHEELNPQGIATKSIDRAKTEEERMQEAMAQAADEAERRRLAEAEARVRARDQILLNTFTTERDLLLTREDRVEAIDSLINLTKSNNTNLRQQIADTRQQIEWLQKNNREVPENISKKLENLEGQHGKNEEFIRIKQGERAKLEKQFDEDLIRYRELKGIESEEAAAPIETAPTEAVPAIEPPAATQPQEVPVSGQ